MVIPAKKISPSQFVNKAYLRSYVNDKDFLSFKEALKVMFAELNAAEREEHNKNIIMEFLKSAFYAKSNAINTYENVDFAIFSTEHSKGSSPLVICEAKKATNPEMLRVDDINRKALHELILYYIIEECKNKNYNIKNLVVTDGFHWFVFEKKQFHRLFASNKKFARKVLEMDNGDTYRRDFIYKDVIKPEVEKCLGDMSFVYFDLTKYIDRIDTIDINTTTQLKGFFKVMSPVTLLDQTYCGDHNTLNEGFYKELLYIIGLEDVKDDNSQTHKIKRLSPSKRRYYSLLEQTILKLRDYGVNDEAELFDTAIGLVLEWVNRILFLKLLEAQLKEFGVIDENKHILSIEHIENYNDFYDLCMTILAKPYSERDKEMNQRFGEIPYLNSSLFELSPIEKKYFSVNAISMGKMKLYSKTKLKAKKNDELSSLEYMFRFLDAYNFSADTNETKDPDTIINASVLGLIFEKINGYKDGAFFTPGYITEYMCREEFRHTFVQRYNEVKGTAYESFDELRYHIDRFNLQSILEINTIIDDIKIVDPAVGSGHFLVSMLNEIILTKAELRVLMLNDKERLTDYYAVDVVNDEILLIDGFNKKFHYSPDNMFTQQVQKALFEEKKKIIENCLFGADVNAKSVDICRLRLWIELLKNSYFYLDSDGISRLQTLPNIDINIKCGDSLLSKEPITEGKTISCGMTSKERLAEYKNNVKLYKNCNDKSEKAFIARDIENFKYGVLSSGTVQDFYDEKTKKEIVAEGKYNDSIEWMIEIPEILDSEGVYKGFDLVIGNPPYLGIDELKQKSKLYREHSTENKKQTHPQYTTFDSQGDLYILFVERAMSLLKSGGRMAYILPNKWTKVAAGEKLRNYLLKNRMVKLVDFCDNQIFDSATTYTCILSVIKDKPADKFKIATLNSLDKSKLAEDIKTGEEVFDTLGFTSDIWITSSVQKHQLLDDIRKRCITLEEFIGDKAYYGVKTPDALIVSDSDKDEMIEKSSSAANVLRPILRGRNISKYGVPEPENSVVFMPKGFTKSQMGYDADSDNKPSEEEAWRWLAETYPSVSEYLEPLEAQCRKISDKRDYWWELRACRYYDKFAVPRIVYQRFQVHPAFTFEERPMLSNDSAWLIPTDDKALLALLNSDIGWWLITEYCPRIQNGHILSWVNLSKIPVPQQLPEKLSTLADNMIKAKSNKDESLYETLKQQVNSIVRNLYRIDKDIEL